MKRRTLVLGIFVVGLPLALSILNYRQQHAAARPRTTPLPGAVGVIEFGILETGSRGSSLYTYEMSPAEGVILLADSRQLSPTASLFFDALPNGAHISTCSDEKSSVVTSPNQRYTAICKQAFAGSHEKNSVLIVDSVSHNTIKNVPIESFSHVRGMAWSPDSRALAILKESERIGYGPVELLDALTGHPVQYSTVGFVTASIDGNQGQGLPYIGREFRSAWCFVKWRQ